MDTEQFINSIYEEQAIWNNELKDYHKLDVKHVSWCKVAKSCVPNFDDLDEKTKKVKIAYLQKKWKSLRDSYRRKCVTKSGQAKTNEKPYAYSKMLDFLLPTMTNRKTESNVKDIDNEDSIQTDNEDDKSVNSDEEYGMVVGEDISVEDIFDDKKQIKKKQDCKRRKKEKTKDPDQQFETKIPSILNNRKSEPDNADKSLLLSLLPEFKTVDQNHKSQLYIDILNTIQNFKRTHSQVSNNPYYPSQMISNYHKQFQTQPSHGEPYTGLSYSYPQNLNPSSIIEYPSASNSVSIPPLVYSVPHFNSTPTPQHDIN